MYSRNYSTRQKRNLGAALSGGEDGTFSLPPRYSGVRFGKNHRNDGREEVFERSFVSMAREKRAEQELYEKMSDKEVFQTMSRPVDFETSLQDTAAPDDREDKEEHRDDDITASCSAVSESDIDGVCCAGAGESDGASETAVCSVSKKSKIGDILDGIGQDDILIIALIVILAGQCSENNRDVIILLALLLCFR